VRLVVAVTNLVPMDDAPKLLSTAAWQALFIRRHGCFSCNDCADLQETRVPLPSKKKKAGRALPDTQQTRSMVLQALVAPTVDGRAVGL
jgi:hypothetical protein